MEIDAMEIDAMEIDAMETDAMETDEVLGTLSEIITLLANAGESNWSRTLTDLSDQYRKAETIQDRQQAIAQLQRLYGGMGSFSDLVLASDGHMLIEKNNRLNQLRYRLFQQLLQER